jgi:Rha family phage regulatory protein
MSKQIALVEDFGVIALKDIPVVSSRKVAEVFGKEHKNVLAAIENCGCSEDFNRLNFKPTTYKDSQGRKQPEVLLTKDGFAFIVMGFTGRKAAHFKEAYIRRFNEMEQFIQSRYAARLESRDLTDAVQLLHDPPKHYHYSNEFDMINRIVLGMPSKRFRLQHGLPKDAPIRDHLTPQQVDAVQKLQSFDAHLAKIIPDYKQRQSLLQDYFAKINTPKLLELTGS